MTMLEQWKTYKLAIYGERQISAAQEAECKRAFYAGAAGFFGLAKAIPIDSNEAMALAKLIAELRDFNEGVKAGTQ